MELRVARADDVAGARAVWRAAGCGEPPDDDLPAAAALLVVAVDGDGEILGLAHGEVAADLVRVTAVAVRPEARRGGIAGALVEALADAAYPRGARRLTAVAGPGDEAAHALYRAVGLEPADAEHTGTTAIEYGAALDPPARDVEVRDGLRLGQLLKLAGVAETGADAKALLAGGEVEVNGEVDQRRGRQLADGDVVIARGQAVRVVLRPQEPTG